MPILTNMFDVTIDYLLDMESLKKDEELKKIFEQDAILFNEGKTKCKALAAPVLVGTIFVALALPLLKSFSLTKSNVV